MALYQQQQLNKQRSPSQQQQQQQHLYPPANLSNNDSSQFDSNDEVSQYFPTPTPRAKPQQQQQQQQEQYQNLPENSAAVLLMQRHQQHQQQIRLETQTPNRLGMMYGGGGVGALLDDEDADGSPSSFRRSASARLHRNKRNYPADLIFNQVRKNLFL